jgi:hypothetical protein
LSWDTCGRSGKSFLRHSFALLLPQRSIHKRCAQASKMTKTSTSRKKEIVMTCLMVILISITVFTYYLDQQKTNWVCGPALIVLELLAIGIQLMLVVSTWITTNSRTKNTSLLVGFLTVGLVMVGFIQFNLNCT